MFSMIMREGGWEEMANLGVTNWKEVKKNTEYRKERNAKRRKSTRSVNTHIAGQLHNKMQKVYATMISAEKLKAIAEQKIMEAETDAKAIKTDAEADIDKIKRILFQKIKEAEFERLTAKSQQILIDEKEYDCCRKSSHRNTQTL